MTRRLAVFLLLLVLSLPLAAQGRDILWRVDYASQDRPGWMLANSQALFSDEGCYVTSLWMLKHAAGEYPGTLEAFNRWLASKEACDPNGNLRLWMQDELGIERLDPSQPTLDGILVHRPVIVKTSLNGTHFYVILGRQGPWYICHDPADSAFMRRTYEELGLTQIRDLPQLHGVARAELFPSDHGVGTPAGGRPDRGP